MMTHAQIESWALDIIERATKLQPIEDARVELKSEWPDDVPKTARQIGGHANAARGDPILWLIGVDQKKGTVPGADHKELADWWPQVQKQFDGLSPDLVDLNVPYDGETVVALFFETDRRPYVVLNPAHGTVGGERVEREVPWRKGTSTRSATRSDLVQMLDPMQHAPRFEFVQGSLNLQRRPDLYKDDCLVIYGYIESTDKELLIIPFHRCKVLLRPSDSQEWMQCGPVQFVASGIGSGSGEAGASDYVQCSRNDARIDGAGMVQVVARAIPRPDPLLAAHRIELRLEIWPVGTESASSFTATVVTSDPPRDLQAKWELELPTSPTPS